MRAKIQYYSMLAFLAAIGILLISLAITSCNVVKGKQSVHTDSSRVYKTDSGIVKNKVFAEATQADWQRQVLLFNPTPNITVKGGADTTINHYIYSGSNIDYNRLGAIINEKGNFSQQKETKITDSSWKQSFDSLKVIVQEKSKQKTEKLLSAWQIIGLVIAASLLLKLFPYAISFIRGKR